MSRSLFDLCVGTVILVALSTPLAQAQKGKTMFGAVKSVADASLTIDAATGDKASHTFSIDAQTQVIARGATQATKGRGRGSITTMIGVGDMVTVTFDPAKPDHATEVRLDKKAPKA